VFKDAVGSSDFVASNGRMKLNNEFEKMLDGMVVV
jgi:hypothetical protein